jgi:glutamine amidotransferase
MGWNTLCSLRPSALLLGLREGDYAYFVHSYALTLSAATIASTDYGGPFSACVQSGNFYGAQFHPERSSRVGARLLQNFLNL